MHKIRLTEHQNIAVLKTVEAGRRVYRYPPDTRRNEALTEAAGR